MGKARIVSEVGEGRYWILRLPDKTFFDRAVARLGSVIDQLSAQKASAQIDVDGAESDLAFAQAEIDALIANWPEPPESQASYTEIVSDAVRKATEAASRLQAKQSKLNRICAHLEGAKTRLDTLNRADIDAPELAWCADYTEGLAPGTEVATVQRRDEGTELAVNVVPGSSPQRSVGWTSVDGDLRPREWQTAEQVFFNAAVLPGVQRHSPKYRSGVITEIDEAENTCSVQLDSAKSSAQALQINAFDSLSNVPIVYMGCDAVAFEVGDHVLVEFHQRRWDAPVVIGFVIEPKPCNTRQGYTFRPADDNSPNGWQGEENESEYWHSETDGASDVELNPDTLLRAGPHYWRGTANRIVTFNHGGMGRYGLRLHSLQPAPEIARVPGAADVYILGTRILTGSHKVVGAALFRDALVIVVRQAAGFGADQVYWTPSPWSSLIETFGGLSHPVSQSPIWNAAGTTGVSGQTPWFFSPTGEEASIVFNTGAPSYDQKIRTLALSGGRKDQDTGIVSAVSVDGVWSDWDTPLVTVMEQINGDGWSDFQHISKLENGSAKAGGALSGSDYVATSYHHSYEYGQTEWDGQPIEGHSVVSGTCGNPPDAFYAEPPDGPAFRDLGSAWPERIASYTLMQNDNFDYPHNAQNYKVTVQRRNVYTAIWSRLSGRSVKWTVSGEYLIALDYLPSGQRIPVTLTPDPETVSSNPELSFDVLRIWPVCAYQGGSGGGFYPGPFELSYYHRTGAFPSEPQWCEGPENTWGICQASPRWANFDPGWAYWPNFIVYEEFSLEIKNAPLRFRICIDGEPIAGTEVGLWAENGGTGVLATHVMHMPEWSFDTDDPIYTPITSEAIISEPSIVPFTSYWIMDMHGPSATIAKKLRSLQTQIRSIGIDNYEVYIEQHDLGGRYTLRNEEVILPNANTGDDPVTVFRDWDTAANELQVGGMLTQSIFDSIAIGLCQRTAASSDPESIGWNFQEMKNAVVVRDGQSALFGYAETNTARRAIVAQFNGGPYTLEATISLPTKDNLRLLDIGAV